MVGGVELNEEALIKQARAGDKNALVSLVMDRQNEYYRLAFVHTGNPEDAMDALQDMIIILYEKINHLKNEAAFYAWSMTILVNCCRRITRQRRKLTWLDELSNSVFPPTNRLEQQIDIQAAIEKLSVPQREAIKLKFLLDMDYETMAKILQIPIGTAKSRVFNGLRNLKTVMEGSNDG